MATEDNGSVTQNVTSGSQNSQQELDQGMEMRYSYPRLTLADFEHPKTLNPMDWYNYLQRPLSRKEMYLLSSYKAEYSMNMQLKKIYDFCEATNNGMYIPLLTDLDGNCLMESCVYYKLADSIQDLRKTLSFLMYAFGDKKNLLPNQELSMRELFSFTNEIEYVSAYSYNKETKEKSSEYQQYTYDNMCRDLANMYAWSNLPTQLVMVFMSFMFNLEFIIHHDVTGHTSVVNAYENSPEGEDRPVMKKIYLALIGETHYVPMDVLGDQYEIEPLFYRDAYVEFVRWARKKQKLKYRRYLANLAKIEEMKKKIDNEEQLYADEFDDQMNAIANTSENELNNESLIDFSNVQGDSSQSSQQSMVEQVQSNPSMINIVDN